MSYTRPHIKAVYAAAAIAVLAGLLLSPRTARSEEPQAYYGRHYTLWYYTLADFKRLEAVLREPPLGRMPGYGPDSDYLDGRLERLCEKAAGRLGADIAGKRFLVVLLDGRAWNRDIYNRRGRSVIRGGAYYDPVSGAVYVDARRAGRCGLVRSFVEAVMDMDGSVPGLSKSRARELVSVPAAEDICACFGPGGIECGPASY